MGYECSSITKGETIQELLQVMVSKAVLRSKRGNGMHSLKIYSVMLTYVIEMQNMGNLIPYHKNKDHRYLIPSSIK